MTCEFGVFLRLFIAVWCKMYRRYLSCIFIDTLINWIENIPNSKIMANILRNLIYYLLFESDIFVYGCKSRWYSLLVLFAYDAWTFLWNSCKKKWLFTVSLVNSVSLFDYFAIFCPLLIFWFISSWVFFFFINFFSYGFYDYIVLP